MQHLYITINNNIMDKSINKKYPSVVMPRVTISRLGDSGIANSIITILNKTKQKRVI